MKSYYLNFMTIRGLKNISAVFGFIFTLAILANAAPPNDNFANPQTISGMSGTIAATNIASTKENGEPAHALNRGGGSVWFKYTAPGNGVLTIRTEGSLNSLLAVYEGTSLNNLKLVGANDDYRIFGQSSINSRGSVGTKTGDVFYIAVDGFYDNNDKSVDYNAFSLIYSFQNVAGNDNFAQAIHLATDNNQTTVTTNVGASKESGEPNHAANEGGKSVWYKWTAPSGIQKTYAFTAQSVGITAPEQSQALLAIYTGASVNALTEVARGGKYFYSKAVFTAIPDTTYYIAIDGINNGQGSDLITTMLSYGVHKTDKVSDVDGDGKADLTVYRPTTGTWYSLESVTDRFRALQWGTNDDKPLIVDKNSDGKIDYTVFRPDTGVWYIDRSDTTSNEIFGWGINTDIPMYRRRHARTGFNDALATVFRPSTGTWYLYFGGGNPQIINWGLSGDIPILADFTGDGTDDITVFRPSTGTWYFLLDQVTFEFQQVQFGTSGDKPTVADYDGDGKADIAIYRPSTGTWWFRDSQTGAQTAKKFGLAADIPQPADYDGDRKADIAVYRNGTWWILQSSNEMVKAVSFGLATDIPITSPAN